MSKINWKGGALTAPIPPVLVTCSDKESNRDNVFTVAWTGILNTKPPKTYISVRPERFSYNIIRESGYFVINLTTEDMILAADFCGARSGRDLDKFEHCGLLREKAKTIPCPMLVQSPLCLECRVEKIVPLGTHDMFIADIVAVDVDETLIDGAGRLHLDRARLAAFAHGEYFALGRKLGSFGYSVRKKGAKGTIGKDSRPNRSRKNEKNREETKLNKKFTKR